jgi:signal transduction histidine kinase
MDKIGGRVWATSTPDAGTTFFVELPAEASR